MMNTSKWKPIKKNKHNSLNFFQELEFIIEIKKLVFIITSFPLFQLELFLYIISI